jgi:hypothetical protein
MQIALVHSPFQRFKQQSHGAEHIVIRNNAARSHSVFALVRALSAPLGAAELNISPGRWRARGHTWSKGENGHKLEV